MQSDFLINFEKQSGGRKRKNRGHVAEREKVGKAVPDT